jgi:PAS domain-containing protein
VESKRELRASEETLQRLIEISLQGVLIVTKEYEPLMANQTCVRTFGFESPAEIMALDSIAGLIASATLARLDAIETEGLDGSETTDIHNFDGVRKDGSIVRLKAAAKAFTEESRADDLAESQCERAIEQEQDNLLEGSVHTLHMIMFPVRDADGKVSSLGAIAADVTEDKRAESRRTISFCQDGGKRAR